MTIKSLYIYPIKGLGGIELQEVKALTRGMQYDRRWMVVDMDGNFITQRTDSRMSLFQCAISDRLEILFKDSQISIGLDECSEFKVLTTVWESEVFAYEVSNAVSTWFSDQLGIPCRLVKMVDQFDRFKLLIKGPQRTKVSFADGYPYSIIGTASLDKINYEIGDVIPTNRFRANIIVNTAIAHEEDTWDTVNIGSAELLVIKACARCIVVNIDQSTGKVKAEPLKKLATYRKKSNEVYFGANSICIKEGVIKVGDKLKLSSYNIKERFHVSEIS